MRLIHILSLLWLEILTSPDVETANKLNRRYDILHKNVNFYNTTYSHLNIKTKVHAGEHANLMPEIDERYHYHHGLKAGDNTLGANLVRVLMRSIVKNRGYDEHSFLDYFIDYMTSDSKNKDPYLEIYIYGIGLKTIQKV